MIDSAALANLLGTWWFNYDEGHFDVLTGLLTEDVHFTCRTDTDTVAWAEFAKADVSGREDVMAWQTEHRMHSPYPLRHHGTNIHITGHRGEEADFSSYIHVTHITPAGVTNLPGGIVHGTVRRARDVVRLAALEVVLDTRESVEFAQR